MRIAQAINDSVRTILPLGTPYGSNRLFQLETASSQHYVAKVPKAVREECSPFWQQMDAIFGINCVTQMHALPSVSAHLQKQTVIPVPEVIHVEAGQDSSVESYALVTRLSGAAHEPDMFPDNAAMHEQLGQYIGYLHDQVYNGYGNLVMVSLQPNVGFFDLLISEMRRVITTFWNNETALHQQLDALATTTDPMMIFSSAHLIMTDISGNQFVYQADRISGVVDLDAYVIGPREWELALLEMCITQPTAFRRGYERYGALPPFAPFREFYRFWSYLCDPDDGYKSKQFDRFMKRAVHFA